MDIQKPVQVINRGAPWLMLAAVGLLVAKFGFSVPIPLLWALSPLWLPLATGISILLIALLAMLVFFTLAFGVALTVERWNSWRDAAFRRKNKSYAA